MSMPPFKRNTHHQRRVGDRNPIQIVVGGQWGSEAKGAIAARLCQLEHIDYAVRTGATNAGHTVYYKGAKYPMQQLPTGWVNPDTNLVLGAGAIIDLKILQREIAMINAAMPESDVRGRLYIDPRAYVHPADAAERSAKSGRHHAIGATGKGCSEALVDRIRLRGVKDGTIGTYLSQSHDLNSTAWLKDIKFTDTEEFLNNAYDAGKKIQLEGTQGQLLDLYLGPYPKVTHKQTGPAQWMSEAGLSPGLPTDIVMVVRTYPIRVAGDSGPMPGEMSWLALANEINYRRYQHAMPSIIKSEDLNLFADAVVRAGHGFGLSPTDSLNMHAWSNVHRTIRREAASELYKTALDSLDPECVERLKALFEMTTVTKKLRRIAKLDYTSLVTASRQIRPDRVAVTFMNYEFPQYWGSTGPMTEDERTWLRANIVSCCGAPVTMINRGPLPEHIINCWAA